MLDKRNDEMKSNVVEVYPAITKDFCLKVVNGIIDTLERYKGLYVKNLATPSNLQTWKSFFEEGNLLILTKNIYELKDKIDKLNNLYIPIAFQQIRVEVNKIISCLKDVAPLVSSEDLIRLESEILGDFVLYTNYDGGKASSFYNKEDIVDFGNSSLFHTELDNKVFFAKFVENSIKIKKNTIHINIPIKANLIWNLDLNEITNKYFKLQVSKYKGNFLNFLIRKDEKENIPEGTTGNIILKDTKGNILDKLSWIFSNEDILDPYLEILNLPKIENVSYCLLNKIYYKKIFLIMTNIDWTLEVSDSDFTDYFKLSQNSGSGDSTIVATKGNSIDIVDKTIDTYIKKVFQGKVVAGDLEEPITFEYDDVLLKFNNSSILNPSFSASQTNVPISIESTFITNATDIIAKVGSNLTSYITANIVNNKLTITKKANSDQNLTGTIQLVNSQNKVYCNLTCTIEAQAVNYYNIQVFVEPTGTGSGVGSGNYKEGQRVNISINPAEGYLFDHWKDDSNNKENPRTITVNGNTTYTGITVLKQEDLYTLTIIPSPSEGGTITMNGENKTSGQYAAETNIVCIATPNSPKYVFDGWYDGSNKVSSQANYTVIMKNTDVTLTAKFNKAIATIEIALDSRSQNRQSTLKINNEAVTTKEVTVGDNCTIACSIKTSDVFGGWFTSDGGSTPVSSSSSYTFEVTDSTKFYALIYYIDVNPSSLEFEADGGTKSFTVTSNIDGWTIS